MRVWWVLVLLVLSTRPAAGEVECEAKIKQLRDCSALVADVTDGKPSLQELEISKSTLSGIVRVCEKRRDQANQVCRKGKYVAMEWRNFVRVYEEKFRAIEQAIKKFDVLSASAG